jgi:ParB-like chromosome segregation protein Spo0J
MRPHRDLAGLNLAVEHRSLDQLIPYARNARTHSPAQVEQIASSIQSFGWTNPILIDGENGIIAGHGRLLAAKELGLSSGPVIELAGLSEAEKRAYLIADNKLALNTGWDEALLAAEVADLQALGVDLDLTGFEAGEIDDLLAQSGATPSFPDEAPPPPTEPLTRPGALWLLGHHRLLCGDATRVEDLRRVLDGRLADLVFTDPPSTLPTRARAPGAGRSPMTTSGPSSAPSSLPPARPCCRSPRARSTFACPRPRSGP